MYQDRKVGWVSVIGERSFRDVQDQSELCQEWAGLVKIPSCVCGIGRNCFRSGWDWSELLQEWAGLVRSSTSEGRIVEESLWAGGIAQTSFVIRGDWSEFLQNGAGLIRIPLGTGDTSGSRGSVETVAKLSFRNLWNCHCPWPGDVYSVIGD